MNTGGAAQRKRKDKMIQVNRSFVGKLADYKRISMKVADMEK